MDFDRLNIYFSQGPSRVEHVILGFAGESENDMNADLEAPQTGLGYCIDKSLI